jgi:hypothetical protein
MSWKNIIKTNIKKAEGEYYWDIDNNIDIDIRIDGQQATKGTDYDISDIKGKLHHTTDMYAGTYTEAPSSLDLEITLDLPNEDDDDLDPHDLKFGVVVDSNDDNIDIEYAFEIYHKYMRIELQPKIYIMLNYDTSSKTLDGLEQLHITYTNM